MRRALFILSVGWVASASMIGLRWAIHTGGEEGRGTIREDTILAPLAGSSGPAPLTPGQPLPDATLITQSGKAVSLAGFKGEPLVLSFIYTHCNMMSMCPMATRKLMEVQALARKRALNVHFLVVSFDPGDTPPVLREYARRYEVDLSNWDFATGPSEVVGPLARSLSTSFRGTGGESFEHNLVVSLVDAQGILQDDFFGTDWNPEELLRALNKRRSP